jgi:hypothetical protein
MRRQLNDGSWEELPNINPFTLALVLIASCALFIGACTLLF